jgi:hypothetical protein
MDAVEIDVLFNATHYIARGGDMLGILARLGHVLYWLGCGGAVVTFAIVALVTVVGASDNPLPLAALVGILAGVLYAVPVWLLGLGCRYILAGPQRRTQDQHKEQSLKPM